MYLKPHNIAIILMAEIIQANAFSMGLCKLPQQEDKGTAAMMRSRDLSHPLLWRWSATIEGFLYLNEGKWTQKKTEKNENQISCPDLFEWKNWSEFQYLIRVIHWYGDRYIQENHEKSKSGTMRRQLWQKRFWGGLSCRARVAAPLRVIERRRRRRRRVKLGFCASLLAPSSTTD